MKRTVLAVLGVVVLLGAVSLQAHHSYAAFLDTPVSLEGQVESLKFASPHTILTFKLNDGTVYIAIWRAAYQLDTMGVSRTALKAGDQIVVSGTPARDPAVHQITRLREVRRLSDGWNWRLDGGRSTVTTASR